MEVKKKLNTLRKREDWDSSALAVFNEWDKQLDELELEKNYLELPQSIAIANQLVDKLQNIHEELLTNRTMSVDQRESLFNLKDLTEMLLSHYSLEENNKKISSIEKEIEAN